MGYPDKPLGWSDLLAKAQSDKNFKWSHPSTTSASGLLATLAEFYAAAGKTRGLTVEDVQAQRTLDYVNAIEKTVRYYGEGEWPIAQRVVQQGAVTSTRSCARSKSSSGRAARARTSSPSIRRKARCGKIIRWRCWNSPASPTRSV